MRILLYNPDNGVTRNFMPHPGCSCCKHSQPADMKSCWSMAMPTDGRNPNCAFVRDQNIGLVGIVP